MTQLDLPALRRALFEGALLLPAPELGTLAISGKDRQTWLNGMITCDLAPLREGQAAYGFAVAKTGKILAELRILLDRDRILLAAPKDRLETLSAHFDHYIIMEDVELEDVSDSITWILAHGPGSADLALRARSYGALAAAPVDMSGKGGAVIAIEPSGQAALLERLAREIAERSTGVKNAPVALADAESWGKLHVEIGLPRWGEDFSDENYPQEASLEHLAVSFQKGCYLGQEAVFMLQMRGHVKKKLVPLRIEGDAALPDRAEIASPEGAAVGTVTSQASGAEGTLALGFVKYKYATAGASLRIAGRNATIL